VKYQFITDHDQQYPVTLMCRVLGVVRSGYYRWRKAPVGQRKMADMILSEHIKDIFKQSRETYGSYRLHAELIDDGIRCGRKRVARLVQENNLVPKAAPRFKVITTDSKHKFPVAPHILAQNFTADSPDRVWLSDMTYVATAEGWLYLAAVMDLYSRRSPASSIGH
jgi:putative transposase